jgi:hypothetical protein
MGVHQHLKIASSNGNAVTTSSTQSWTGHRVVGESFPEGLYTLFHFNVLF